MVYKKRAAGQTELIWRLFSLLMLVVVLLIAFNIGSNVFSMFTGDEAKLERSLESLAEDINDFMNCNEQDCPNQTSVLFSSPIDNIALFGMGSVERSQYQEGFRIKSEEQDIQSDLHDYVTGQRLDRGDCDLDTSCICGCESLDYKSDPHEEWENISCENKVCVELDQSFAFQDKIYLDDVFNNPKDQANLPDGTNVTNYKYDFSKLYWQNSFVVINKQVLTTVNQGSPSQKSIRGIPVYYIEGPSGQTISFISGYKLIMGHPQNKDTYVYKNTNSRYLEFNIQKNANNELSICIEDCE